MCLFQVCLLHALSIHTCGLFMFDDETSFLHIWSIGTWFFFVMQTVGLFVLDLCFWSLFCLPGTLWVHSNSEEIPNCSMVCVCGLCMWFHGYYFC